MGKFTEGHTLSRGPRKPGGGKKKSEKTIYKEAVGEDYQYLPQYIEAMRYLALRVVDVVCPDCQSTFSILGGGDREALKEQLDRHLGKTKQVTEILGGSEIGRGAVVSLFTQLQEVRRQYLETPVLLKESNEQERTDQVKSTALQGEESVTK